MASGADLNDIKRRMDGAVTAFKSDIASLRTGRASANLLECRDGGSLWFARTAEPGRQCHRS